jgi:hypothetical protein
MSSSTIKVEYATDITLGRIVRLKSYRVQSKKGAKSSVTRVQVPRADSCVQCDLRLLFASNFASQLPSSWKIIPIVESPIWYFVTEVQMVLP